MFDCFIKLFKSEITVIEDITKRREDVIKQLVSRYSNGNANLQQSKYITNDILKAKQKSIFS
jgi:hypothetical protein